MLFPPRAALGGHFKTSRTRSSFRTVAYFSMEVAIKTPYPHMQGAGDSGR